MKCTDSALGGNGYLRLRDHLAAERAHRILARMRADVGVVVDLAEVEYRQQVIEICRHSSSS
jgi:hypothetical protein